jgi:hypothetical protein
VRSCPWFPIISTVSAAVPNISKLAGFYNGVECSEVERGCRVCYCTALLFAKPFSELVYCPSNSWRFFAYQGLNVALGAVTAVVNVLLELYSQWAVNEEVHTGRTAAQATTAHAQFMAQFLNTVTVSVRASNEAILCI